MIRYFTCEVYNVITYRIVTGTGEQLLLTMLAHQFATMVELEHETSVAMSRVLKTKFLGRYRRQDERKKIGNILMIYMQH
jgi:hypothetical protein